LRAFAGFAGAEFSAGGVGFSPEDFGASAGAAGEPPPEGPDCAAIE
jgi:hypothetical protein